MEVFMLFRRFAIHCTVLNDDVWLVAKEVHGFYFDKFLQRNVLKMKDGRTFYPRENISTLQKLIYAI